MYNSTRLIAMPVKTYKRKMFIHSCDVRILLPIALMMDK